MNRAVRLLLALLCLAGAVATMRASGLVAVIFGVAAGLSMRGGERREPREAEAPQPQAPPPAALIEAVDEPLLLVEGRIVAHANAPALTLLGRHIVGEDVRVAIRHPEAAARLAADPERLRGIPLSGLGGRDSRWEMAVTPIGGEARLIHLADRSATHAAEAMRVDFVANASHELRTPLATLLGYIETLADPDGPRDEALRRRFLGIMQGEAQRMRQLVDDLISLSRIEAERHRLPDKAVALPPLVASIAEAMRVAAGEAPGTFVLDTADPLPPVTGDEARLSQLFNNLMGNALKYRRPGTPVAVALDRVGDAVVRVRVTDQGEGIPADHLPRLTERFYRVDAGRSRSVGGTGLGLAIVKHIVERHRGRLDIASTVGVGTTVTVTLPAAPEAESQKGHPPVIGGVSTMPADVSPA